MHSYDLTKKADADLKSVLRYTIGEWGLVQAEKYKQRLHAGCEAIATGQGAVRRLNEIDRDLYGTYTHN